MGDFVDAIGRGIGGLVGGSIQVIGSILDSMFGFLSPILPGPLLPVVLVGVTLVGGAWFLLKR